MRVLAHVSDLHFGTEDPVVAVALLRELDGTTLPQPSLVAVTGDLTQRARKQQFAACREFLDQLPGPYLAVPGNHDVPMYNVVNRFLHPFERYQHHIGPDLAPSYVDDELQVEGINTAHALTLKGGRITAAELDEVCGRFERASSPWKVLLAHHPFVIPAHHPRRERVHGATEAVPALARAGVRLILSGHLHLTYLSDLGGARSEDRAIVAIQAGTCISTRRRGEPNSYNRLTMEAGQLRVLQRIWDGRRFVDGRLGEYRRAHGSWHHAAEVGPSL